MNPMQPAMTREQAEHEARAKIFWGDEPETVIRYLQIHGVSYEEAEAFVDGVLRERIASVRKNGGRKMLIGLAMLAVPVAAYIPFAPFLRSSFTVMAILGLAGAVGLWGLCKMFQGVFMLIFPENEAGDVSDQAD